MHGLPHLYLRRSQNATRRRAEIWPTGQGCRRARQRPIGLMATQRGSVSDDEGVTETQLLNGLIVAAAQADSAAFARLYDLTSSRIFDLVMRVVREEHCAEEIVQDSYVQYWRKAGDYDPVRGTALMWMMTIAYRRAVDRARIETRQNARASTYGLRWAESEIAHDTSLELMISADEVRTLHTCLGHLTDFQRESLEMSYFGDLTYPEVAAQLGTPVPTAKTRIRDGLRSLRACMSTLNE